MWLLASLLLLLLKDHLANKTEILAHLQDIVAAVKEEAQLEVITLFGYEFLGQHDIVDGVVECVVKWTGGDGGNTLDSTTRATPSLSMHLRGKRMIKATGFDIEIQKPLKLASQKVVSFSPADILRSSWNAYMRAEGLDKPIYFVGSGKVSSPHVVLVGSGRFLCDVLGFFTCHPPLSLHRHPWIAFITCAKMQAMPSPIV